MITALLCIALSTGTVKLHLVDEGGKPIPNHPIWLAPTNSTKPIRDFGVFWYVPETKLTGTTNASGDVAISGVPRGKPMMVVTTFGPRFDPYLKKQEFHPDYSVDLMKFEGAVYAGRPARVMLAQDYSLEGKVVDYSGKALAGVKISLQDTGIGHMSGYPLTEFDSTTTDEAGNYRFEKLPNCSYTLTPSTKPPYGMEELLNGRWDLIGYDTGEGFGGRMGATRNLTQSLTRCDFRMSKPAQVTVALPREKVSLKDWAIWVGDEYSGWLPGYDGWKDANGTSHAFTVLPGTYHITFERETDNARVDMGKVTVGEGDHRTVEVRMSEVLRRAPKKSRNK